MSAILKMPGRWYTDRKDKIKMVVVSFEKLTDILLENRTKEEIISAIDEKFIDVKRPIDDSFHIIQRLLQLCPDLYNISDENIKNKVKENLKILKNKYECTYDY